MTDDTTGRWPADFLCTWEITEREIKLFELATQYHAECDRYDSAICTGPIGRDGVMPADAVEFRLINRNAQSVRARLFAGLEFSVREINQAIADVSRHSRGYEEATR